MVQDHPEEVLFTFAVKNLSGLPQHGAGDIYSTCNLSYENHPV